VLALIALVFIVVPLVELYVIVQVGQSIGVLNTIALVLLISLVGAWLARHEGTWVLRRIREQIDAGAVPTAELVDGALVLSGGILLLTPGFVTDGLGLLLLFPPTRAVARRALRRRFRVVAYRRLGGPWDRPDGPDDAIDV
jgi:UPF0716 protein FxsA